MSTVLLQPTSATYAYPPRLPARWSPALLVPRAPTKTGQQSFDINGPTTWKSLPPALRVPDLSQNTVKHALKTHLSRLSGAAEAFRDFGAFINAPTYLLVTPCHMHPNTSCSYSAIRQKRLSHKQRYVSVNTVCEKCSYRNTWTKLTVQLETVSIAEALQNRQHAQNLLPIHTYMHMYIQGVPIKWPLHCFIIISTTLIKFLVFHVRDFISDSSSTHNHSC